MWQDVINYHPDGYLTWRISPSMKVKAGARIGSLCRGTYLGFGYKGTKYSVHRVVWELHNGAVPKGLLVDHINRNRLDNRIENLRLVTASANSANSTRGAARNCYWVEHTKAYQVRVEFNGSKFFGGYFKTLAEAKIAAAKLRSEVQGEYQGSAG